MAVNEEDSRASRLGKPRDVAARSDTLVAVSTEPALLKKKCSVRDKFAVERENMRRGNKTLNGKKRR